MADKGVEPPAGRRKQILNRIQAHDYDVLTKTEVHKPFEGDWDERTTRRYLKWMAGNDVVRMRKAGNTIIYWIDPKEIPAKESVLAAQQVGEIFSNLVEQRWEFRLMAFGIATLFLLFSASFWVGISLILDLKFVPETTILSLFLIAYFTTVLLILASLFIFPIETWGDWTRLPDDGSNDEL